MAHTPIQIEMGNNPGFVYGFLLCSGLWRPKVVAPAPPAPPAIPAGVVETINATYSLITSLKEDMSSLSAKVAELSAKVGALSGQVGTLMAVVVIEAIVIIILAVAIILMRRRPPE